MVHKVAPPPGLEAKQAKTRKQSAGVKTPKRLVPGQVVKQVKTSAASAAVLAHITKGRAPTKRDGWNKLFKAYYVTDRLTMRNSIREGVPARTVGMLADVLDLSLVRIADALGIPASTVRRKVRANAQLEPDQTERLLGLQRLIGQIQTMVEESGNPEGFDAAAWTKRWLDEPHPALDGAKPIDYLDTMTGQQILADLLARNVTGAYA